MSRPELLLLGAVAYDPKVVTIWNGFKAYLTSRGIPFDYVLFSNYERQVDALVDGTIDVAWNSPLAYLRAQRIAAARGQQVRALVMRDTDRDLSSVIIVRADSPMRSVEDLRGKVVAVGAIDSPQATLIPLATLRQAGLEPSRDFAVQRHDVLTGLHGDHIGGEREAAQYLVAGKADAACVIAGNYDLFVQEGTIPEGTTRELTRTACFDHCNFTAGPRADAALVERFRAALLAMSYDDPELRPLFDMEGLKGWREGRVDGYCALDAAIDQFRFYDQRGDITVADYRY